MIVPQSDSNLTNSCLIQTLGKNVFLCSKLFLLNLLMRPKQVSQTIFEIKLPRQRLQGMIVPQSDSNLTNRCSIQSLGENIFLCSKLSQLTLPIQPKQLSQTTIEMNLPHPIEFNSPYSFNTAYTGKLQYKLTCPV